jgi:hypothetical protein
MGNVEANLRRGKAFFWSDGRVKLLSNFSNVRFGDAALQRRELALTAAKGRSR